MPESNHSPRPLSLSERLTRIVESDGPDRLTFTELAEQLHSRAWGALLLTFATINVIPLPPGASMFFAIPLLLVSAQMVAGREAPWFPPRIDRRGVTKQELRRLIAKMGWLELRVERIFKPRLASLTGPVAARVIGAICFVLALATALPFVHMAPAAAVILFGLALIYRDGALAIAATFATLACVVLGALLVSSGFIALSYASSWLHR